jgi:hypothetical protein
MTTSTRRRLIEIGLFFALVFALVKPAAAQIVAGLDVGSRSDQHENGQERSGLYGGGFVKMSLFGTASESFAFILPAWMEFKAGTGGRIDLDFGAEGTFRIGWVSFGPGFEFYLPMIGDVLEPLAKDGQIAVSDVYMLGYSGSAKLNFGPLGRAFIQGKWTVFPKDLSLGQVDGCANSSLSPELQQACRMADSKGPDFVGATESRLALGYTFGEEPPFVILRLLWTRRHIEYARQGENLTGAYNRSSDAYTLGLAWMF